MTDPSKESTRITTARSVRGSAGRGRVPRAARTVESLEPRTLLAATLPSGFQESVYVTGFDTPTAQAFAPDGRLFVLEKAGKVRVVSAGGTLNATPFMQVAVDTAQDRGLVALAFDPNFQTNRYLYLWYTTTDASGTRNRLSRVTASGSNPNVAQAGSELVLLEVPHATNIHTGGAMGFGADGMLYLGVGDGGQPNNAQNLGDLRGKVLRLNVVNPSNLVPADNPFVNTPGARKEIFALGLRNPFTGQMKPGTNTLYVNDVGETQYEEVDVIAPGADYGWPGAEGPSNNAAYTNPLYAYSHAGLSNAAITGGAFYTGSQFPSQYAGSYFFADYLNGFMRRIDADGTAQNFGTNLAGPLDIDLGPDGSLYYLSAFGNGFTGTNRPIYRISYVAATNRPPSAVAAPTTATNGSLPLTVGFTGNGSSDPDGDALTYAWDFGDGTTGVGKDVSHAYATRGTYFVTLTVSDGRGGSQAAQPIRVDAGNRAPTGTIASPAEASTYVAGQTISFAGSGTDPEDGNLPASRLSWMVYLVHNTHEHQFAGPFNGTTSGAFVVPATGHVENDHHYRIELTVTDSAGLAQKTSRRIDPVISTVTLQSSVPGLSLALDGQPRVAPFGAGSLVGATRSLTAPATQTLNGATYEFVSWSDGKAMTHDITVPSSNTTYTATYRLVGATQTKLAPAADTYARDGTYAGTNYGSAASLFVKKSGTGFNRQGFLKFDTTAFAGTASSVKLRLYGKLENTGGTNVVTDVFRTSTTWTESGLTWRNKPAPVGGKLGSVTVSNTTGKYYEVDVTAFVNAERGAGRNVIALALINPSASSPATAFNSRQASSNKPELVLSAGSDPAPAPAQTPFGGTASAVPGTIQAEDFDNGGEAVAYHDVTAANEGNATAYRTSAVDLDVAGDTGGGYNVGWMKAGEWLEYTVNVAAAGAYTFDARVASLGQGGTFSLWVDGVLAASNISIPDTGGYQTYQTVTRAGINLAAGQRVLRVQVDAEGTSGFAGNINWMRFTAANTATAPNAPSGLTAAAASASQVNLSWTDASSDETGFKVERKTGTAGAWAQIAATTAASYIDAGRAANTLYAYRVRATNGAGDSVFSNEASVTTPAGEPVQSPYAGGPWAIPGTIEVENFDDGGEGVAYQDSDAVNQGGAYRTGVGADVEPADDVGAGHNVGYIKAGEWLEYTVTVAASGTYDLAIRVASGNPGGTFHLEFDGVDKTGPITLPYTGSWDTWVTVTANGVSLAAGTHVMRLAMDASNFAGADIGRVNWVRFTTAGNAAAQTPFGGSPIQLPGRVQAEDFDNGGEGVAYHDLTVADEANVGYRASGVEVEVSGDTGGGYGIGWMKAGEWLEYTLDVPAAGDYALALRVASLGAGGALSVLFGGVDKTGAISVPDTGGWQTYTTVGRTVPLAAGQQVMRVLVNAEGGSGFAGNLNYIDVTAATTATTTTTAARTAGVFAAPPPGVTSPLLTDANATEEQTSYSVEVTDLAVPVARARKQ